jgi:hypothetical protein
MQAEGFSRFVRGGDGVTYHLPLAEYARDDLMTIEAIRDSAQRAARLTSRSFAVLVTKGNQWAWLGLTPAQQGVYTR